MAKRGCMLRRYLAFFFSIILCSSFIAATGYSSSTPSHKFLYADFIRGMVGASIIVNDRLNITSDPRFTASFSESLKLFSSDTSPTTIPLLVTSSSLFAAGFYGGIALTAPYITALSVNVNHTGAYKPSAFNGKVYNGAMSGVAEREVILANASYAAWGATDDAYYGFIAGTDPFSPGKAGAAGLVSPTRGGTMGTLNYGVYGQYDSNKGYLGSPSYGVYGEAGIATGYSGFFYGGQGVSIVSGGLCVNSAGCDPDANGVGSITASNHIYAHTSTHVSDFAEPLSLTNKESVGAGDVVTIDPNNPEHLIKSAKPFDPLVAGVISSLETAAFVAGTRKDGTTDKPLALAGQIYVKASAENGAIKAGDLLTTSSTPGHAMKCKKSDSCFGAVLGKALEPLSSGKGKILALVMLG